MTIIGEAQILWQGVGGPGVSTFHVTSPLNPSEAQGVTNALQAFADDLSGLLPNDYVVTGGSEVKLIDDVDGQLTGTYPINGWQSSGQAAGVFSRAAGARIDWLTQAIVAGRRLRGRTYWVPITSGAFTQDGILTGGTVNDIQDAGEALINALAVVGCPLLAWSPTHGVSALVEALYVPPKGAILRSRRD